MKLKYKIALVTFFFLAMIALLVIYLATYDIAVLDPKGIIGFKERKLIINAFWIMMIVVIPVFILTFLFAWKYREDNEKAKHSPDWEHSNKLEVIWWGVPFIIITVLSVITWISSHDLSPFKPLTSDQKPIKIQVVALQWKWLFIYPEEGVASINFFQFPENTPLEFEITADAPMNSFWIPQLGGQIYAMPAMRSQLHLMADKIGEYRGSSANISGQGFAGMIFTAKASSEQDYKKWLSKARSSGQSLNFHKYNKLVEPTENNPPAFYKLTSRGLFDEILAKYEPPAPQKMQKAQ